MADHFFSSNLKEETEFCPFDDDHDDVDDNEDDNDDGDGDDSDDDDDNVDYHHHDPASRKD